MNLLYAHITKISMEEEQRMGTICYNGVLKKVPLLLLPDAQEGDEVLVCDGVPLSKIDKNKKGGDYVFGNTRQSA